MEIGKESGGSGIPRRTTSRLPQFRSNRASVVPDPGIVSSNLAENGITSPCPQGNGIIVKSAITSPSKIAGPFSPPPNKRSSMLLRPGFQTSNIGNGIEEVESIAGIMSPPLRDTSIAEVDTASENRASSVKSPRKSRPSLSDRTVETLSQIPPSPSPAKRRQSGFYSTESPMRLPSRPMSAFSHNRPGSQMGGYAPFRGERPESPTKRAATVHDRSPSVNVSGKRVVSSDTPNIRRTVATGSIPAPRLQQPSGGLPKPPAISRMPFAGSKTVAARPTRPKSPIKGVFDYPTIKSASATSSQTGKTTAPFDRRKASLNARQNSTAVPKPRAPSNEQNIDDTPFNNVAAARSSQALRDVIRKAKSAKRNTTVSKSNAFLPRSIDHEPLGFETDTDPSSLDLLDSSQVNILRKRVNNAREDGKLNIAALCLQEIPVEVLKMYDPETAGDGGPAWYECVDITRLNAADNDLAEIPEEVFPENSSPQKSTFDAEDEPPTAIFAGLEVLDMHGNQLKNVPLSLGRLSHLTFLNLSRNQLGSDSLETIARILSLRELRLAENSLKGAVPDCIGNMENLESLDLHGNAITEISGSFGKLSKLRHLNVSSNQLSGLPMEAIFDLPIIEINASRNRLSGSLLPANIPQVPFLQNLDISMNALLMLSDIRVDFPSLRSLNIANNRVAALPDMTAWQKLTSLNAEENKISEIPAGFTSLKNLTRADFGNNSLLQLDDGIGSMDGLATLNIQNNPLRERRFLRLSIEDLKSELRSRVVALSPTSERSGSISNFGSLSRSASWTFTGDTLDRSNTRLKTIDKADLEPLAGENIRTLILHHNQLSHIPSSLDILGSTLTTLDLSNNKLAKNDSFLPRPLNLPNLLSLNLTSNGLTTLNHLVSSLTAPKLTTLILLFNRLTALPTSPSVTTAFPSLSKLLASNNKITVLDFEAVRGLQVLDVSGNEIETLPPRLALLQGTLRTLIVNGNRFRVPGWGILEKGTEEILQWCRRRIPAGEEGAVGE
ncbi:MAG: hypothetical protein LQ340_005598 [Diploschistes diacapsis]|nr:MAG: hypothetical protein LQ340_005598 [Diploschistes diacapsis]